MSDEKWIDGLHADMRAHEAALLALTVRLGAVRDRLPDAVLHAEDDVEHVHHLRVSTRRAAAALRLFAECLPASLAKKARKALRQIRRSAGEARDWDVFLAMLQPRASRAPAKERRGLDFLIGYARGQRVVAQEHLRQAHDDKADQFSDRIHEVQEALESSSGDPSLADLALPMLTKLLHEFEGAARGDLGPYEALHQVRILGKQLRYAMEIFACCFGPDFREKHYDAVVEMQDILGDANDSHTACQRLQALRETLKKTQPRQWPQYRPGIEGLLAFHEKRLPAQRAKFERWWRRWLKSGGEAAFSAQLQNS
jgi:CHAD domain-containing protein